MAAATKLTEDDIRAAVDRFGVVVPGVPNEKIIEHTVKALNDELVFKDVQGISDSAMEAVYAVAYNDFQAGKYDAAHKLFVFLCMFDHMNKKYWMALGACRFAMKDYVGASGAYGVAGMVDDHDPVPPLRAADCHLAGGDVGAALEALEYGISLCGGKPEYKRNKARAETICGLLAAGGGEAAQCPP